MPTDDHTPRQRPSWREIVKSVAASAFGVQSQSNYQRDFSQSSVMPFIIVGIVFVIALVLMLALLVNLIV